MHHRPRAEIRPAQDPGRHPATEGQPRDDAAITTHNESDAAQKFLRANRRVGFPHAVAARDQESGVRPAELLDDAVSQESALASKHHDVAHGNLRRGLAVDFEDVARPERR